MSKIILKKSAVAGKQPVVADLEYGELALNYADSKLFFKTADNTIAQIGGTNLSTALQNRYSYVASEGQSNFSAIYIPPYVDVFLNGLRLSPGEDYIATTGTNIVLTPGATISDLVEIVSTTSYTVGLDTALQNRYNYTATALQTSFVANYIPGYVDVYKNGVKLNFLEDFTATNGSQVVLSTGCAVGDLIEIIATTSVAAGNAATATTATNVLGGTASVTTLTTSGAISIGTNASGALASFGASNKLFIQGGATNNGIFTQSGATLSISPTSALNSGIRVGALGDVTILNTTVSSSTTTGALIVNGGTGIAGVLSVGGNLTFSGANNRITGDFSNATVANRVAFQSSTTNGATSLSLLPNGSSTVSGINCYGGTDPANSNAAQFAVINGGDARIQATANGTASAIPMTFYTGGSERLRIDTSGNVGIGTSSPASILTIYKPTAGSNPIGSTSNSALRLQTDASEFNEKAEIQFQAGTVAANTGEVIAAISSLYTTYNAANDGGGALLFSTRQSTATGGLRERARIAHDGTLTLRAGGSANLTHVFNFNENGGEIQLMNASGTADILFDSLSGTGRLLTFNGGLQIGTIGAHALTFNTSDIERMRITSAGNVGIGITAPSAKLAFANTVSTNGYDADKIRFFDSEGNVYGIGMAAFILGYRADNHVFYTSAASPAERMRIDSSGNLLVGTTSAGASNSNSVLLIPSGGLVTAQHANGTAAGTAYAVFNLNGVKIGSITQYGTTAVLYNTTSDQRLKENIQDSASASSLIDAIQVRQYDWKSDGSHQRYGFIAQELVAVAPEAVHQPADPEEMMAVDYSKLVPMLVKEIQSLRARVAALESN